MTTTRPAARRGALRSTTNVGKRHLGSNPPAAIPYQPIPGIEEDDVAEIDIR